MEVVPDIDELLDQLEASELLDKNNTVDHNEHKIINSADDITLSSPSKLSNAYVATEVLVNNQNNTDHVAADIVFPNAVVSQPPNSYDCTTVDSENDNASDQSAIAQDTSTDKIDCSKSNLCLTEEFTTSLIDIESLDIAGADNKTVTSTNTSNVSDSVVGGSSGVHCANVATLAVLEEIFACPEADISEKNKQHEPPTKQTLSMCEKKESLVLADNPEQSVFNDVPPSGSPTESDFAEMETYLAGCLQPTDATVNENVGKDLDRWTVKGGDFIAGDETQLLPTVVRCNRSGDALQDEFEADDSLLTVFKDYDGLSQMMINFEEKSPKNGCKSLLISGNEQPKCNLEDDNNRELIEQRITDVVSSTLGSSIYDVTMSVSDEQQSEVVETEMCRADMTLSNSLENKASAVDVRNHSVASEQSIIECNTENSIEFNGKLVPKIDGEVSGVCDVGSPFSDNVVLERNVVLNENSHNQCGVEADANVNKVHADYSKGEMSAEEGEELCEDSVIEEADEGMLDLNESNAEVSVVASTHDISAACTNSQLTESELQLGKVKPDWIADAEMANCMLCCAKFTFLLRRHHCRSCGRLLCAQCTSHRAFLPYMNEPTKKFKVCGPCAQTLERIQKYEEEKNGGRRTSGEISADDVATASFVNTENAHRTTKSALKIKTSSSEDDHVLLSSSSEVGKRSVKFRDGVSPGSVDADSIGTCVGSTSSHSSKPRKMRTSVSKRLKELRMEEENVCFLPDSLNEFSLYYRTLNGTIHKYDETETVLDTLNSGEPLIITVTRNLWCKIKLCELSCCQLGKVVCIISCGMWNVGLDEIFIAYDLHDTDDFSAPLEIVHRIYGIYKSVLKNQDINSHNKIGIQEAHLRMPNFYPSDSSMKGEFTSRDLLLFRPSVQCFENLLIPDKPFFVGCFLHHAESVWALSIPQRLLYRIGLHASCYPTPIVNIRSRQPVYFNITDTTVLKMFCDFKNWVYRLPVLHGSVISLCDNETRLSIPNFQKEEVKKLTNYNKNMFAWALSFNDMADSHLVCEQGDDALYKTQVFTSGDSHRRVTGASFIVIDGALKGTDVAVNVNVVEDGITIRLRPDAMAIVTDALSSGKGCKIESSTTTFVIEWIEIESAGHVGELVSPIDKMSLMGKYQYGLSEERIFSSLYLIPGVSDWALRLVAVYNCDNGKFPMALRPNVFAVAEQIAGQLPYTITPFVNSLTRRNLLELCIRIHITPEEAEYKAASWDGLESEFATWTELLDNQLVPGLFNVCSYISVGFTAEICFALISTCSLP